MRKNLWSCFGGAALGIMLCAVWLNAGTALGQEAGEFPLKDGDTWVMIGDSITAQHMHSNYIEAFCFARFPKWTLHFRNAGVSSDTVPRALARFDWDVAPWKPTVISVELGMNDRGIHPGDTYINDMKAMADRIRAVGARPVFFTSSAVNDGSLAANQSDKNKNLTKRATALRTFAAEQKAPFADQYHALVDLWGSNKPVEICSRLANDINTNLNVIKDVPGREHLQQWLDLWSNSAMQKRGVDLGGNPVHPGPVGQLTMAAALLRGLNAPGLVSKATLDSAGKVGELIQCQVTNVIVDKAGGLSFDRLDECLPMPIPDGTRGALIIYPSIAELSQWILAVTGLKAQKYNINIDGTNVAGVTSGELGKGWNMGVLEKGPVADQCRLILQLVDAKEALVSQWRAQSQALLKNSASSERAILEQLNKQVLEADARIHAAAQPKSRRFTIIPAE